MKKIIIELLEKEMDSIRPMFIKNRRIFNEFETDTLLISFEFEDINMCSTRMSDILVSIKQNDITETVLRNEDLGEITVSNLLTYCGMDEYQSDLALPF